MTVSKAIDEYLKASSISGLSHIANEKKSSKLFWMFTVFVSFLVSAFYINLAFESWSESPVKTLIETLPSNKLTFPKVKKIF